MAIPNAAVNWRATIWYSKAPSRCLEQLMKCVKLSEEKLVKCGSGVSISRKRKLHQEPLDSYLEVLTASEILKLDDAIAEAFYSSGMPFNFVSRMS